MLSRVQCCWNDQIGMTKLLTDTPQALDRCRPPRVSQDHTFPPGLLLWLISRSLARSFASEKYAQRITSLLTNLAANGEECNSNPEMSQGTESIKGAWSRHRPVCTPWRDPWRKVCHCPSPTPPSLCSVSMTHSVASSPKASRVCKHEYLME